jgi:surface antigen
MKQLDANTLVAYVDGELDTESAALVESLLAEDDEAREVEGMLRHSASLIHAAHNHVLHEVVPERLLELFDEAPVTEEVSGEVVPSHLVNMILDAPDEEAKTTVPSLVKEVRKEAPAISLVRQRSVAAFATAAVFAAVMVGGGMMLQKFSSPLYQAGTGQQAHTISAMNDPWREAAFQEALENRKSEAAVVWSNPENGRSGAVVPVKTYRRDDGTFCRAFRTVDTGVSRDHPNYGVACREPGEDGRWIKAVEAISTPGTGAHLKY